MPFNSITISAKKMIEEEELGKAAVSIWKEENCECVKLSKFLPQTVQTL